MVPAPNQFVTGQKESSHSPIHFTTGGEECGESKWVITRMTQFLCTELDLFLLVKAVSLFPRSLTKTPKSSFFPTSLIYKEVFCLRCLRKSETESHKAIVSFDPEQRAFCLNDCSQTQVFAKHPFAVLALSSSPTGV